jgi:hypothetical protein
MNYIIIGDSLIEKYEHHSVVCYPGMTLEYLVSSANIYIDNLYENDKMEHIICFGINDLSSGIPEDEVIENYAIIIKKITNCNLILPPLQTDIFYEKCLKALDCTFITSFICDYNTNDGLHPNIDTLTELKKDIEKDII